MSSTSKYWLTPVQTAQLLGVTPRTLRAWRQQCKGPDYRQDGERGRVLYSNKSVMNYLQKTMQTIGGVNGE
ncbi:helix-turn-helix transcriptional regulator [Alloscardovia omnicolens]